MSTHERSALLQQHTPTASAATQSVVQEQSTMTTPEAARPSTHDIESASSDTTKTADESPTRRQKSGGGFLSRDWLFGAVDNTHGDLVLLSHSFASGMTDAAAFSNWSAFVAMQTGNTVLLGLATATTPTNPHAWLTTLVSIVSYLVGVFVTFRLAGFLVGGKACNNRLFLCGLFMLQAILVLVPAALVQADIVPHNVPGGPASVVGLESVIRNVRIVALLPPLAFQAGIQIACSRLMGYNELPVNVITSTYCDIMGDSALFGMHNTKRNRRVASVVLLFLGAISSAWLLRSSGGMGAALFVAGGIKFIAAVLAFVFMPVDKKLKQGK